jgi:hypothetical protein
MTIKTFNPSANLVGDDDFNIDTSIDGDVGQLSHDLRRGVKIQDALVDAHLEAVEGVGTLTARRLADQELQDLGGHSDGARHLELLLKSLVLELSTDSLNGSNVSGSQGDANAVDGTLFDLSGLHKFTKLKT